VAIPHVEIVSWLNDIDEKEPVDRGGYGAFLPDGDSDRSVGCITARFRRCPDRPGSGKPSESRRKADFPVKIRLRPFAVPMFCTQNLQDIG